VGKGSRDDLRLRQLHRRWAVPARVADPRCQWELQRSALEMAPMGGWCQGVPTWRVTSSHRAATIQDAASYGSGSAGLPVHQSALYARRQRGSRLPEPRSGAWFGTLASGL